MKPKLGKSVGDTLKKASPTIVSCIGAVGVVATAVLAGRGTVKAVRVLDEHNYTVQDKEDKRQILLYTFRYYIPAAVTGAVTIACIIGANVLNRRRQAALASAYTLVSRSYNDYKQKLKELYGEEAHEKVLEALAVEKAKDVHIHGTACFSDCSLEFEDSGEELRLFYDSYTERYFQTTISQVLQAEIHLNRNFALGGGYVPLSMFYEFLGIDTPQSLANEAWWVTDEMYWIDFNHTKTMIDDGINGEIECYIIDMIYTPTDQEPD